MEGGEIIMEEDQMEQQQEEDTYDVVRKYIGAKIILAYPKPLNGREGYSVIYPDKYESWSPKETFENAYREILESEINLIEEK